MAEHTYFEVRYTNPRTSTQEVVQRKFRTEEDAVEFARDRFRGGVDVSILQMVEHFRQNIRT